MKVRVLKQFVDIHTNEVHAVGQVFEASEDRVKEIQSKDGDLIEVVRTPRSRKKVKADD